ncbi:hypothetical protein DRE_07336 [Drechslerella stenobrocha 248]|uniref:Uncharacterized protein n=1 Tax=Drechslerella stenobrocha 248 TaxID=1043628 RepID=W7HIP2_9PEZI|nr:hypothetical protein DRE_07336 [Drechslerella stenobrocha 248]
MQSHFSPLGRNSFVASKTHPSTRQTLLDFLLKLVPGSSSQPDYADPPSDRLRGMIYAAAYQRIQNHVGASDAVQTGETSETAEKVQKATDLTSYIYPLHSFDAQVDICVKIVSFKILCEKFDDIDGTEDLQRFMIDLMSSLSPKLGQLSCGKCPSHSICDTGEILRLWPLPTHLYTINTEFSETQSHPYFGPISTAATGVAIAQSIVDSIINLPVPHDQSPRCADRYSFIGSRAAGREDIFLRILALCVFPEYEFSEGSYGRAYFPFLSNLIEFTKSLTAITTICHTIRKGLLIDKYPESLKSYTGEAIGHYNDVKNACGEQERLWEFAEAYMKGHVCAMMAGSNGLGWLFDTSWRVVVSEQWEETVHLEAPAHNFGAPPKTKIPDSGSADGIEIETNECAVKSIVAEYDSWEFLR